MPPSTPLSRQELDLSSTFVSKARLKVGSRPCQRKGKEAGPAQKEVEVEVGQEVDILRAAPVWPCCLPPSRFAPREGRRRAWSLLWGSRLAFSCRPHSLPEPR